MAATDRHISQDDIIQAYMLLCADERNVARTSISSDITGAGLPRCRSLPAGDAADDMPGLINGSNSSGMGVDKWAVGPENVLRLASVVDDRGQTICGWGAGGVCGVAQIGKAAPVVECYQRGSRPYF